MQYENELVILLYHGVTESESQGIENFSGKHIAAEDFARQMAFIKRNCSVLSVDEVVSLTESGKPYPKRPVLVSFDDGFLNNATVAAPILVEQEVPAVFYVCPGMMDTRLMFWVDKIECCINTTTVDRVTLALGNETASFDLDSPEQQVHAVTEIKGYCKQATADERERVLSRLMEQTRVVPSADMAANYRMMAWDDVRALHENPLFTIGGHTLYHDIMTSNPLEKVMCDTRTALGLLEYNLGERPRHYSYPEGQESHFNQAVIQLLRDEGIVCCPSALHGVNSPGMSLFHLQRIMVGFLGAAFPYDEYAG